MAGDRSRSKVLPQIEQLAVGMLVACEMVCEEAAASTGETPVPPVASATRRQCHPSVAVRSSISPSEMSTLAAAASRAGHYLAATLSLVAVLPLPSDLALDSFLSEEDFVSALAAFS